MEPPSSVPVLVCRAVPGCEGRVGPGGGSVKATCMAGRRWGREGRCCQRQSPG